MSTYKDLLTKYIDYVGEMEGVDFIPRYVGKKHPVKSYIETGKPFTQEELEMLWECTGWDEEKEEFIR